MVLMDEEDVAALAAYWGVPMPANGPASPPAPRRRRTGPQPVVTVRLSCRPQGGGFTRVIVSTHQTMCARTSELEARKAARNSGMMICNMVTLDVTVDMHDDK